MARFSQLIRPRGGIPAKGPGTHVVSPPRTKPLPFWLLFWLPWVWSVVVILALVWHLGGFHLSLTPSLPIGVYQETNEELRLNTLAVVCLPTALAKLGKARGYLGPGQCPEWVKPIVKPVAAMAGDTVTLTPEAVFINGERLPNSASRERDSQGRSLRHYPFGVYRTQPGELWLISTYAERSWDGRYLGPFKTEAVETTARPVWTVGERSE